MAKASIHYKQQNSWLGPCCRPLIQLRDLNDIITLERVLLASWCYLEYTNIGERKHTHTHIHTHTHTHTYTHTHTHTHPHRFKLCRKTRTMEKQFAPQVPFPWGVDRKPSGERKKKILFFQLALQLSKVFALLWAKSMRQCPKGSQLQCCLPLFQVLGNEIIPLAWQLGQGVTPVLSSNLVYPGHFRVKIIGFAQAGFFLHFF